MTDRAPPRTSRPTMRVHMLRAPRTRSRAIRHRTSPGPHRRDVRGAGGPASPRPGGGPGGCRHGDVVDEAVPPGLLRLGGGDERVVLDVGVLASVPVRGGVAAPDVSATQADPQVYPVRAGPQTGHAAGCPGEYRPGRVVVLALAGVGPGEPDHPGGVHDRPV